MFTVFTSQAQAQACLCTYLYHVYQSGMKNEERNFLKNQQLFESAYDVLTVDSWHCWSKRPLGAPWEVSLDKKHNERTGTLEWLHRSACKAQLRSATSTASFCCLFRYAFL